MRAGPDASTDELIVGAQRGDTGSFEHLFTRFAGRVKAFAMVRGARDPDEIANDVMLRVFENIGGFSGSSAAFEGWVFTIARNRVIDAHRAAVRRPHDLSPAPPDRAVASAETEAMVAIATAEAIDLLNTLTEDQREVVALRMLGDLSTAQVAEVIGKPESAVKALQRRGLARLQREILDNPYRDR